MGGGSPSDCAEDGTGLDIEEVRLQERRLVCETENNFHRVKPDIWVRKCGER
jgi:hypothetical protein